jgi:hypothetical protein
MTHSHGGPFTAMDMAGLTAVGVAFVAQMSWFVRDARLRLDAKAFGEQLRKLVAADNADRAIKLSRAAAGRPAADFACEILEGRAARGEGVEPVLRETLRRARRGLAAVSALTCVAVLVAVAALVLEVRSGTALEQPAMWALPVPLLVISVRNGMRWGGWREELRTIMRAVGDR